MLSRKLSEILALVSVGGGLLSTFISGLYAVKPFVVDAEMVYFGFPLAWFEAARGGLFVTGSWHYYFLWGGFIFDFLLYGSFIAVGTCVYFMFLLKKPLSPQPSDSPSRLHGLRTRGQADGVGSAVVFLQHWTHSGFQ